MITIKDIAQKAGVSISTVSYALNNDSRITKETKQRIINIANELGYKSSGKNKKSEKNGKNIVIYLHTLFSKIFSDILTAVQKVMNANGYNSYICISDTLQYNQWVDGMIVLNSKIEDSEIVAMAKKGIPIITLDRNISCKNVACITIDNVTAMYQITKKVLSLGKTEIMYIAGVSGSYDSEKRYEGFLKAIDEVKETNKHVSTSIMHGDFTTESGRNICKYLVSAKKLPSAFICANDEMAIGVINVLTENKIKIPDQVIVTGFDGITANKYVKYKYISANVDRTKWGSIAAYTIIELINNGNSQANDNVIPVYMTGLN